MAQLLGLEVSDEVAALNAHHASPKKQPPTDARKIIDRMQRERLENLFDTIWCQRGGNPDYWLKGHLFDDERGWHIDRYNPEHKIGVEIHGGQFMKKSGHSNATGQQRDWEKVNRCHVLGIRLFGLTTAMVNADEVMVILEFTERWQK